MAQVDGRILTLGSPSAAHMIDRIGRQAAADQLAHNGDQRIHGRCGQYIATRPHPTWRRSTDRAPFAFGAKPGDPTAPPIRVAMSASAGPTQERIAR